MTSNEELKQAYNMFSDCWKLFKKYADIRQDEDTRWEEFVTAVDNTAKAYGNGRFIRDLLLAVTLELERRSKGEMNNAETQ